MDTTTQATTTSTQPAVDPSAGQTLPDLTGVAWIDAILYGGFFLLMTMALFGAMGGSDYE